MNAKILRFIFPILLATFLLQNGNNFADTSEPSDSLKPGTASGKLSVNVQTFKLKYAYARTAKGADENEAAYLVLLTNRSFPLDISKITRFEFDRYADRFDLHGLVLGIDNAQHLIFADILRVQRMISTAEYQLDPIRDGVIKGRVYTKGEIRFFRNRVKYDIQFNAKI